MTLVKKPITNTRVYKSRMLGKAYSKHRHNNQT